MVRALMMSKEQIAELVKAAHSDRDLWEALKDRERNQFHEDGTAKIPSKSMLVSELVKERYGHDHIYDIGSLIVEVRRHIRQELSQTN